MAARRIFEFALCSSVATFVNPAWAIEMTCPHFSLTFGDDGRPVSLKNARTGAEQISRNHQSPGFVATYAAEDGAHRKVRLDRITLRGRELTASCGGFTVVCLTGGKERYLTMRIRRIDQPRGKRLLQLRFELKAEGKVKVVPLDYVTRPREHGISYSASWPWIWGRNEHNPLGAFALHLPLDDEDSDETLLHIWVNEGLPHPKVAGAWTLERARTWLAEWQRRFVDQSTMVVQASTPDELYKLTDYAIALDMKKIYLHTDTWRGEYWPVRNSFLHVRRDCFPAGEADLRKYANHLADRGLSIALHTVSCSIGRFDPDYVKGRIDPRLATWVTGSLAAPVDAGAKTIRFRPDPGQTFPRETGHEWFGPGCVKRWMNAKMLRIGDEFVQVGAFSDTDGPVWTCTNCKRGFYETRSVSHAAGTKAVGLLRPYGQAFTAGSDTTLIGEVARRFGGFCNRNNVSHLECDGLEVHQDLPWGPNKFTWLFYEQVDHPATSNTSSGRPLRFHMEYWFNGSRPARNNHPTGGVAGGDGVPLYLHHDDRPATGPYEIHLKPTQRLGRGGATVNLMRPRAMFGISVEALKTHGLSDYIAKSILKWKKAATLISTAQRKELHSKFGRFRSPLGQAGNQAATDTLYRPGDVEGRFALVPLRVMSRPGGEINWGWGQEFGPLVPRQYLRTGDHVTLENPFDAQAPEFVIRVMPAFGDASAGRRAGGAAEAGRDEDIVESYYRGAGQGDAAHPLSGARHIWCARRMDGGGAKSGTCAFRTHFEVSDPGALDIAALVFLVDDHSEIHLNGKKIHSGGEWNCAYMIDMSRSVVRGRNTLAFFANNYAGPACLTAAIVLVRRGARTIVPSDASWLSSAKPAAGWKEPDFDDRTWEKSHDLGAFGSLSWPRAKVQPVVAMTDLMPRLDGIRERGIHRFSLEGKALRVQADNDRDAELKNHEGLPRWRVGASMHKARGIGMTVTGDASGAVLAVTVEGRGRRDYVVPIDFTGRREIVIPCGEVAWSEPRWAWRGQASHIRYENIHQVCLGFGRIPAKTRVDVKIERLRVLREREAALVDPVAAMGDGTLRIRGTVRSNHYLWYRGGRTIGVYDLNWNETARLSVRTDRFVAAAGANRVSLRSSAPGQAPWLEMQFVVSGAPMILAGQ